jgi:hypothetical protein
LRPRLETMRHWTTSFQLLRQGGEYGADRTGRNSECGTL